MTDSALLQALSSRWRGEAEHQRELGAMGQACTLDWCASELERALQDEGDSILTLKEAAALSGLSADHLGRLVREGKIPNAGRENAPRIRRGDVPIKTGALRAIDRPTQLHSTKGQVMLSVATQEVAGDG